MLSGCSALVEAPPDRSAQDSAPAVLADDPAARGIANVRLPTLSEDGFERKAEALTVRVRNLGCEGLATGSGFAVSSDVLITNRHVVAGADQLEVDTSDGRSLQVDAASVGVLGDVAAIQVNGTLPVVAQLKGQAQPGASVTAVGYPLGGPLALSRGVVVDSVYEPAVRGRVLRITARVEPGNSGGPLLDSRGRVVGIVFAIETATRLGLAIPISTVSSLLQQAGTTTVPPCGSE